MPPASTRRLLLALAASLGVHGALWLALEGGEHVAQRPPPARTPALQWVDVEVAEARVPADVRAPTVQREPAPSRRDTPAAPEPGTAAANPSRLAQAGPATPVSDDALPPAAPRPPRQNSPLSADAPRAAQPPSGHPEPAMGSRLLLAARQVTALPGNTRAPEVVLDGGVVDPHAPPSAQSLVEELVSESVGRGRVERGLVHPYYGELGKALMRAWDADRAVKEHGLQGYFDMGMERGRAYSRVWMERAADYGASGSFAARNRPSEDRRRPPSTAGDASLNARREMRQQMRQEFHSTRRALIRVVQDSRGQLLDVQLLEPSHQPEVDREAVKDVRAAAERLPPPPPEAVGGRARITSVWEFELRISISPPIPSFSFEFDEALGFVDTRLPLDRRIYKRVRLVEVR